MPRNYVYFRNVELLWGTVVTESIEHSCATIHFNNAPIVGTDQRLIDFSATRSRPILNGAFLDIKNRNFLESIATPS